MDPWGGQVHTEEKEEEEEEWDWQWRGGGGSEGGGGEKRLRNWAWPEGDMWEAEPGAGTRGWQADWQQPAAWQWQGEIGGGLVSGVGKKKRIGRRLPRGAAMIGDAATNVSRQGPVGALRGPWGPRAR